MGDSASTLDPMETSTSATQEGGASTGPGNMSTAGTGFIKNYVDDGTSVQGIMPPGWRYSEKERNFTVMPDNMKKGVGESADLVKKT